MPCTSICRPADPPCSCPSTSPRRNRGARRDATFENVLKKPLAFPDAVAVSPACKDLITKLLNKASAACRAMCCCCLSLLG